MSQWTQTDWRFGMWSATSAATIGVVYVFVGLIGVVARLPSPDGLRQVDPYLAVLEAGRTRLPSTIAPPESRVWGTTPLPLKRMAGCGCFAFENGRAHSPGMLVV